MAENNAGIVARPKLIDMHSHWATKRGYVFQTEAELKQQEVHWRSKPKFRTETEQAQDFRDANVQAILDFGFTAKMKPEQAREHHDYAFEVQRSDPDAVIGNWINVNPKYGQAAVKEFERCLSVGTGFVGLSVQGSYAAVATDPGWEPFYNLCIEANVPALIFVGYTGAGAGHPGGGGVVLDDCHPRYLDRTAATHPNLKIIAARQGWPWVEEAVAVLIHKPNVVSELHGWSPKYFGAALKHDLPRRLRKKLMFGADYPIFEYDRLVADYRADGYSEEVLADIFSNNAERYLATLRKPN